MRSHPELTYARPNDRLVRRLAIRSIEELSGRRRLARLYAIWQRRVGGGDVRLQPDARADADQARSAGRSARPVPAPRASGDGRQPPVRDRRRRRAAGAGRAAGTAIPHPRQQRPDEDTGDGCLRPAGLLRGDQGGAGAQHGDPQGGDASAGRGHDHRRLPRRRRRHGRSGLRGGRRPALEAVHRASHPDRRRRRPADPLRGPERAAVPPGQPMVDVAARRAARRRVPADLRPVDRLTIGEVIAIESLAAVSDRRELTERLRAVVFALAEERGRPRRPAWRRAA